MWLDWVALAIVAVAALAGALRGALVSTVRLLGAVGAYAGAWMLGPRLGSALEARTELAGALAVAVAGLGVFVVLLFGAEVLAAAARAWERRRGDGPRPTADRLGGAAVSLAAGLAFVVLVGWLAVTVDALRAQTGDLRLPSTEGSRVAPWTRSAVRAGAGWLLSDRGPAGEAAARAVADPAATLAQIEALAANPHWEGLREDRHFWRQVEAGRYDEALHRASFLALAYDGTTRRQVAELGLVDPDAARSSRVFRDAAREALAAVGPRLRALREDPALERLASDPEVQEMVMANDTLGLLRHPDVRVVLARALADPGAPETAVP